jgi:hypothetical protein
MVVLTDSQPGSPTKAQHDWSSQPGTSQAGSSGPRSPQGGVVRSPEAFNYVPPPAYVPGPDAPLLPGPTQKPRRSTTKRFCSALAIALMILVFFNILSHTIWRNVEIDPSRWVRITVTAVLPNYLYKF